jgi:hypothetical protein
MMRKPRARIGLHTTDHSKNGRRFLSVLDPATLRVTVLDPYEHLIFMLCDGRRDLATLSQLSGEIEEFVEQTLLKLERENVIEECELDRATIAECFEIPTGEFDNLDTPFLDTDKGPVPPGLDPTIAWGGEEDSA